LHCLALEKQEIPPIHAWSNDRLVKWFDEMKWEDLSRLARYHKIVGKTISEADDEYLEGTLGLIDFA